MKFIAEIDIMPLDNLLDPQGKAVKHSLEELGYKGIEDVRLGQHIVLRVEADNIEQARETVDEICRKVLYNPIVHKYSFQLYEVEQME